MKFHNQWSTKQFAHQPKDWLAIRTGRYTLQLYAGGLGLSFTYRLDK